MSDLEARLRSTLHERVGQAPRGTQLAERILLEVETPGRVLRPRRGWSTVRTWTMPLLAAGAVAAVVATVVGIGQVRNSAAPAPPAHSVTAPTQTPTRLVAPAPMPRVTDGDSNKGTLATTVDTRNVKGFKAIDLTFVSQTDGWALGPANCVRSAGTCSALFHTTDGVSWHSAPDTPFNVKGVGSCAEPCVDHIRFANAQIGYVFGPQTLLMTTDGGASWTPEAGGAEALETAAGNVIRLVASVSGCPGPCDVRVETARIGSSTWHTTQLQSGVVSTDAVQLVRSGSDAYVLATRNPASGASTQTSTLYRSSDSGATWHSSGEPCPYVVASSVRGPVPNSASGVIEDDSTTLAAAPGGVLTVLCRLRGISAPAFIVISTDHGATFARPDTGGDVPMAAANLLAGSPDTALVAAGDTSYRSVDGGVHWTRIAALNTAVTFLGFESADVGRAITNNGRTIWTTTDAGRSWQRFDFP